jgi:hypothetical protein
MLNAVASAADQKPTRAVPGEIRMLVNSPLGARA